MCVALLTIGLSIASAVAEFSAASAQADAQNQFYLENAREAQRAARDTYVLQQKRIQQEREATNEQLFENDVKAMEKRGTAYNSAGEAGVSGLSVDALIGNIYAQQGRQDMANLTQFEMNRDQVRSEMQQTQSQAQARINSVQKAVQPSFGAYLLKGLAGGMGSISKTSSLAIA